jgi:hypothetical protein
MTVTGRSPEKEGLVLAFYHDFAHLGRSAKVQTVHGVYKEGWPGDLQLCGNGSGQGNRAQSCSIEASTVWWPPPHTPSSGEKYLACGRSTQLALRIATDALGIADHPCQWQRCQDL